PGHRERFAFAKLVAVKAGDQLRETRQAVGQTFDQSQYRGTRAYRRQQRRHRGGGHFMSYIREEARESDAENGAVQPSGATIGKSLGHVFLFATTYEFLPVSII